VSAEVMLTMDDKRWRSCVEVIIYHDASGMR
jgi:hypothetical protein